MENTPTKNHNDELISLAVDLAVSRETNVSAIRGGIAEEFAHITGIAVQRWGLLRRMTLARIQLSKGLSPGVVARNLGYSHLPAFNRAFTATHGCTPMQYQADCARIPTPWVIHRGSELYTSICGQVCVNRFSSSYPQAVEQVVNGTVLDWHCQVYLPFHSLWITLWTVSTGLWFVRIVQVLTSVFPSHLRVRIINWLNVSVNYKNVTIHSVDNFCG